MCSKRRQRGLGFLAHSWKGATKVSKAPYRRINRAIRSFAR